MGWTNVCKESDFIHLEVAGTSIVVMNSAQVAEELLDQRSAVHSDRYVPCHLVRAWTDFLLMQAAPGNGE